MAGGGLHSVAERYGRRRRPVRDVDVRKRGALGLGMETGGRGTRWVWQWPHIRDRTTAPENPTAWLFANLFLIPAFVYVYHQLKGRMSINGVPANA